MPFTDAPLQDEIAAAAQWVADRALGALSGAEGIDRVVGLDRGPGRPAGRRTGRVEIWLESGQWDLAGELLAVDACLAEPVCDGQAWQRLAAAQRADGLLPRDSDPVAEDPDRAFKDHEHTAVVAIAAGTLTVARALGSGERSTEVPGGGRG
ncbi:DUF6895 family protein [Kitasatospora sp. NPDC008050]|uniref:DUF6895 family protein n=1 Tax=Kitasatospora sp. NPDC008050 TaxID=3364021 RepID=UPI0036E92539